ncbi:MAG: sigma-70 family RNA polymerase sigma factor [Anaerolineales bacterium]|nr:sigma-70 family RNA polymerase sigma factor [Chloroflexota bacterium]MBL6982863.1 sigma-70 family RNA polymerase sigma factor [Anaerolineales bacterium]
MSNQARIEENFSLEALQNGDPAEFARVVEANSGYVYRLAMKMLQNPQDAEDILQETFIKAYKAFPNFNGRSKISTWLYRIATNEALMFLRKKRPDTISVEVPKEDDGDEIQKPIQIVDWCCLPEAELMSDEAKKYLGESVDQLPENLKMTFILRDIEGLSTRETAEILEISETAVKTRLHRARLQLREILTSYYRERLPETV